LSSIKQTELYDTDRVDSVL